MSVTILRPGKTAKDHKTGAWARHQENRKTRSNWNYLHSLYQKGKGAMVPYPVIGVKRTPLEAAMMRKGSHGPRLRMDCRAGAYRPRCQVQSADPY